MIIMPNEKISKENNPVGKSPEEIKENIQRKTLQFQILQANMQIIREKENMLLQKLEEFENTKQTIGDMKSVKSGSEILMPLGSGNFVSGKISSTEKVLVGIGGGIAIKKSSEDAVEFLNTRTTEVKSALQELKEQGVRIEDELHLLQSEMSG